MKRKVKCISFEDGRSFLFDKEQIKLLYDELEDFISYANVSNLEIPKQVIRTQEVKTNNNIEGYQDNISSIEKVLSNSNAIKNSAKKSRIINLYNGYNYILKKHPINKDNLKELFTILSKDLLEKKDIEKMGDYYRLEDVFIHYSDNLMISPDKGVNPKNVDYLMEKYFEYLENKDDLNTMTDYYIKSLISHLYFVYIHPYYDINGRTSRTCSMWYLLNNKADPYVLFNRAIDNKKSFYYKTIHEAKESADVTKFIKNLMISTKMELEKEYVYHSIKSLSKHDISLIEYNTIISILSMKGLRTLKDFATFYNKNNENKRIWEINDRIIEPLLDKEILVKVRNTKSYYDKKHHNFAFDINPKLIEVDRSKVRRINI